MTDTACLRRFLDTGELALPPSREARRARPSVRSDGPARTPPAGSRDGRALPATRRMLLLLLLRLPDLDRELLRLHLKGLAPGEIAQRLGLGPDAARRALERAIDLARRLDRPAALAATASDD